MQLKVLDLSRVLAGPLCAMILGDLGARVIKVERPGSGDETRGWGPPFSSDGTAAYYLAVNRNKKSVALNLSSAGDRRVVDQLIREADVVVENFLPGALTRLGLDRDAILSGNPSLIWCTISGFGSDSARPGYDFVVQAESGWMSITGDPDGPPMKVGVALADVLAGKDAAIAILAAVSQRAFRPLSVDERRIEVSLSRSAIAALVNVAQNVLVSGEEARRWGNAHPNLVPYQLFQALDRPFVIAVGSDSQWKACVRALGLDELAKDESLAKNEGRVRQRTRVVDAISGRVRNELARHWTDRLDNAGVPCGLVRNVGEALAGVSASASTGVEPSVPGAVRLPPPHLDEHGAEIRTLGWRAFQP